MNSKSRFAFCDLRLAAALATDKSSYAKKTNEISGQSLMSEMAESRALENVGLEKRKQALSSPWLVHSFRSKACRSAGCPSRQVHAENVV